MIGNLGKSSYVLSIAHSHGNTGSSGNNHETVLENGGFTSEQQFPTIDEQLPQSGNTDIQSAVPAGCNFVGNSGEQDDQLAVEPMNTAVLDRSDNDDANSPIDIPRGHGIYRLADLVGERDTRTLQRNYCYWCKSTDLRPIDLNYPEILVCARCHPPLYMYNDKYNSK